MDRKTYLKPTRFGKPELRRAEDAKNMKMQRSIRRTMTFNAHRQIEDTKAKEEAKENKSREDKVNDRRLALQKFKAEKEALKRALKEKQRPPFIVGIPHHGNTPILKEIDTNKTCKAEKGSKLEVRHQRITRATTKTLQAVGNVRKEGSVRQSQHPKIKQTHKALSPIKVFPFTEKKSMFSFLPPKVMSAKKLTSPHTPTVLKRSAKKLPLKKITNLSERLNQNLPKTINTEEVLAVPLPEAFKNEKEENDDSQENTDVKWELGVEAKGSLSPCNPTLTQSSKMQATSQETEQPLKADEVDEKVSPPKSNFSNEDSTLTQSSKKQAISPETKQPLELGKVDEEVPPAESDSSNEAAFQYARLEEETHRLLGLADLWETTSLHQDLPQEITDEIDSVTGQTRLLTSDKFKQFEGLIKQFQDKTGTHIVNIDDLNGFWDMIYLQVESLIKRYENLEFLKNNNWIRPEPCKIKKKVQKKKLKVNNICVQEEPSKSVTGNQMQVSSEGSSLLHYSQSRTNSPAPYIAMRLSGILKSVGRSSNMKVELNETPQKKIKTEESFEENLEHSNSETHVLQTPQHLDMLSEINTTIKEEPVIPTYTPRRSQRLIKQRVTPTRCDPLPSSANHAKSGKTNDIVDMIQSASRVKFSLKPSILSIDETNHVEVPKKSKSKKEIEGLRETLINQGIQETPCTEEKKRRCSTRQSRKITFNPDEEQEKLHLKLPVTPFRKTEYATFDNSVDKKQSASRVKFSLKPSILSIGETNNVELPKKSKSKREIESLLEILIDQGIQETPRTEESKRRRSTRQSRKVTFDAGQEQDKQHLKLPVTPFRGTGRRNKDDDDDNCQ